MQIDERIVSGHDSDLKGKTHWRGRRVLKDKINPLIQ